MEIKEIEAKIEAILFTMGEAVEAADIAKALDLDAEMVQRIIRNMKDEYENESHGVQIIEINGAFQMCTKASMYETIVRLTHIPKKHVLSDVLLETLSIIAYKQPITKQAVEAIRGVNCDHVVNKLVEYNLVEEVGRLDVPGRPALFATTEDFLRTFGLTSLDDLPVVNQEKIADFKEEAEEEAKLQLDI